MDNRPIGFFDSGRGGLTCVKALKEILPDENIIFYADTARCPYGVRSASELCAITDEILNYLKNRNVKAIVVACGTLSTVASEVIRNFDIKTFSVYEPAVNAMRCLKGDKALAVLGTKATVESGAFQNAIGKGLNREIFGIACQDFVQLCESGHTDADDPLVKEAVERYLSGIKGKVDAVLLGCTHFGLLDDAIKNYLPGVETVSASREAAKQLANYLIENDMTGGEGAEEIICSGYEIC